ncbi:MAG TPA: group III truncated hemoglobin [Campylobacterales bacterium]|nr:group III truncated hemoglobin [Campylobacterales bacterium]
MLTSTLDRASVEKFVRAFYVRVLNNEEINPYFIEALGNDLSDELWETHYQLLTDFWLMLMTGEKTYTRDPFEPHLYISRLTYDSFDTWLKLFKEELELHYTQKIVDKFHKKAAVLAKNFIKMLEKRDEIFE